MPDCYISVLPTESSSLSFKFLQWQTLRPHDICVFPFVSNLGFTEHRVRTLKKKFPAQIAKITFQDVDTLIYLKEPVRGFFGLLQSIKSPSVCHLRCCAVLFKKGSWKYFSRSNLVTVLSNSWRVVFDSVFLYVQQGKVWILLLLSSTHLCTVQYVLWRLYIMNIKSR